jgi:hypothetical protein
MLRILICIVMAMSITGCGLHEFKAGDPLVALEQSKEQSKAACYEAMALTAPDYSKLDNMAVVLIEQQKAMLQMVGAVTGKNMDPCSGGTNLNDGLIADSNNRNQASRAIAGTVGSVATTGIIAAGAVAAIDSIGYNSGVKTYGDSSPATKTSTKTTSTSPGVTDTPIYTTPTGVDPVITP